MEGFIFGGTHANLSSDHSGPTNFTERNPLNSNTRTNAITFQGIGSTSFNPTPDFIYGFKGRSEVTERIIAEDRRLLIELGVTHGQIADLVDAIFATDEDMFCDCPLVRWENVHSPVCPWGDFCTVSSFSTFPQVTEIWLVNPYKVETVAAYLRKVHTNVYPIKDLKRLVDEGLIMVFSDLHPHLIREHHFFEGLETPYRVHPEKMVPML